MKKTNSWIVGVFFLITLFHYVDTAISGDGHRSYFGVVYLTVFAISMLVTRKSKACNLIYLIYSYILCVAIILCLMPFLLDGTKVVSFIYYLCAVLTEPFLCTVALFWGDADPLSMLFGVVVVYLFPFATTAISFCFYTKNKCEQKEPGSV